MAKEISMRHTKLKPEEAALILGEVSKPSWESKNEGIHERVSFEDTIWGFDLAGGAYYKTPLRVTYVKPGSRAEKANVRAGDLLLRINNLETSTMTIKEAHDIILESGMNLKLNVTAPEDLDDSFYYYEDPMLEAAALAEKRLADERARRAKWFKPRDGAFLKLKWPWVSKRCLVYRESNCFLVPSKYEEQHKDKFPVPLASIRYLDDVILDNMDKERYRLIEEQENRSKEQQQENSEVNGVTDPTKESEKPEKEPIDNVQTVNDNSGIDEIKETSPIDDTFNDDQENNSVDDIEVDNDAESVSSIEEEIEENYKNNEPNHIDEDGNAEIEVENSQSDLIDDTAGENTRKVNSTENINSEMHEDIEDQIQNLEIGDEESGNNGNLKNAHRLTIPQISIDQDDEQDNSSESEEATKDILDQEDDAHKLEDIDSNSSAMRDLVNDNSDISQESTGDNRNI